MALFDYWTSPFVSLTDWLMLEASFPAAFDFEKEPDRNKSTKTVFRMIKAELIKVVFVASCRRGINPLIKTNRYLTGSYPPGLNG